MGVSAVVKGCGQLSRLWRYQTITVRITAATRAETPFKMSAGLTWRSGLHATPVKYLNTCPPPAFELWTDVDKENWAVSTFIPVADMHII